jgi:hypothetical protein
MKKILVVLSLLLCVGCVGLSPDLIEQSAQNIAGRHDAYVKADPVLTVEQREAYLQETELFLKVIEEAKK